MCYLFFPQWAHAIAIFIQLKMCFSSFNVLLALVSQDLSEVNTTIQQSYKQANV